MAKTEYEVKLDKDMELVFDKNFNIIDIESKAALPEKVVPLKIGTLYQANIQTTISRDGKKKGKDKRWNSITTWIYTLT